MPARTLATPPRFALREVVYSHGWYQLAPWRWEPDSGALSRVERLPAGDVALLGLSQDAEGVRLRVDAPESALEALCARARWLLSLDEPLEPFHALCRGHAGLRHAAESGGGRMLRSPTVWEDAVKTLFSVNTTWRQTIRMTARLVELCGEPHPSGARAFPAPTAVLRHAALELQEHCRVGYRAGPLLALARAAAHGEPDLESLQDPRLPEAEVASRLRALPGFGPYAAANMLMLLGRYDHLPVDSWFRRTVREAWFDAREVPDARLIAAFEPFRPYRALAYQCYDWSGDRATAAAAAAAKDNPGAHPNRST